MILVEALFWVLLGLVLYVYVGYPLLLMVIAALKEDRRADAVTEPRVTVLISAYNEAGVIAAKLRNSIELDYPPEKLEIIVISDASSDETDQIVSSFSSRGVRLFRMPERSGKTLGLNEGIRLASGDIVVFSDANALYARSAIRALVRHFADPSIGAVVGQSRYDVSDEVADRSESAYWHYETFIKRLEAKVGSVVGGDGAIYAIRRECYRPMKADALSDFVNPLQIVKQGLRCVYDPEAVSMETAAGSFGKEFRRKVRIVNRAWRAMRTMPELMNPLKYGFFSIQFVSHKLLRWLVPFFLLGIFATNVVLWNEHVFYRLALTAQVLFYGLAAAGYALDGRSPLPRMLYIPFYFCLVNFASANGIFDAYRGKTYTTWSTARSE